MAGTSGVSADRFVGAQRRSLLRSFNSGIDAKQAERIRQSEAKLIQLINDVGHVPKKEFLYKLNQSQIGLFIPDLALCAKKKCQAIL